MTGEQTPLRRAGDWLTRNTLLGVAGVYFVVACTLGIADEWAGAWGFLTAAAALAAAWTSAADAAECQARLPKNTIAWSDFKARVAGQFDEISAETISDALDRAVAATLPPQGDQNR